MNATKTTLRSTMTRFERTIILSLLLTSLMADVARAEPGTPAQKRACTPDVYRLCAGEIPNVRAIVACLRRNMGNLSDGCRAVFASQ